MSKTTKKYDYRLVPTKQFSLFLKKLKEHSTVYTFDEEDNITNYVVNTYIVAFSQYDDDNKLTSYFVNAMFEDLLEDNYE